MEANNRLCILFVEDIPTDAELAASILRREGLDFTSIRVDTETAFLDALETFRPDLIVSDYSMPEFDGIRALKLAVERAPDLPFIILTGATNEAIAVECMKTGAWDYVLKDRISRLPFAVREALNRREALGGNVKSDAALWESEDRYRNLVELSPDAILIHQAGKIVFVNSAAVELFGASTNGDLLGKSIIMLVHPDFLNIVTSRIEQVTEKAVKAPRIEEKLLRLDGSWFTAEVAATPFIFQGKPAVQVIARDVTSRKRADEALQESREILQAVLNAIPVRVFWKDKKLVYLGCNAPFARDAGFSRPEEIIGQDDYSMGWREQAELYRADDRSVIESGKAKLLFEEPQTTPSGEKIHLLTSKTPLRDADGEIVGVLGTYYDVTDRKRAEEARQHYQSMFVRAESIAHIGSWELNIKTIQFIWSDEIYRIYGFDKGEFGVTMATFFKSVHPDDRAHLNEVRKAAWYKGKPFELDHRIIRPDGEVRILHEIAEVTFDDAGQPDRMIGTVQDVTERKRVTEALERSEAELKHMIEHSNDVIYVLQDHTFKLLNFKFEEQTGWTREEAMAPGFDIMSIYTLESREYAMERSRKRERGEPVPDRYTFKFVTKKGEIREFEVNASSIIWDGKPAVMGFCRDITDQKQLEAQLQQAQKMESVGRLAGGVAHDFNNMLQAIMANIEMALDEPSLDNSTREKLIDAQTAARRSADLTKQLLAFARKQTVAPKVIDLGEAISGLMKMLKRLIGEDIELSLLQKAHVGKIKIDPTQIDQILANLCLNARDAISNVGKITIETGMVELDEKYCADHPGAIPGRYAVLRVSDNGCGMSQEVADRIFEPFFTTKAVGKGTGLGLAMVYGIVKQNNGYITVESELGHGSTFIIHLPSCDVLEETPAAESRMKYRRGDGETVLLVEDEPAVLFIAKASLERLGYRVLTATSPMQAMTLARNTTDEIHLLLTDVVMPGMNGRDMANHIKQDRPGMRCLFMSGYTADVMSDRGVLSEGINFIQKPFSFIDLATKITEVMR